MCKTIIPSSKKFTEEEAINFLIEKRLFFVINIRDFSQTEIFALTRKTFVLQKNITRKKFSNYIRRPVPLEVLYYYFEVVVENGKNKFIPIKEKFLELRNLEKIFL